MSEELAKILVVDDQSANLVAMKKLLAKVDVQIVTADSGNQALAQTLEHDFALILLDINMPEMDGYEVAECLAGEDRTCSIPIIFVTAAYKDMSHTIKAYGSGAVDYIEKPINETILLAKVRVFLELYKKSQQLHTAKERAEKATADKSAFLAQVSHEIRTPMNAVIGFTHLFLQTELTPQQQEYLESIQTASSGLLELINDLLDHSKIEAGQLDIESVNFNLSQVIDHVSTLVVIKAQQKGLEILFSIDDQVPRLLVGDPQRLGQVLSNLANNAINFTEAGEVIISATLVSTPEVATMDDQVMIEFSVTDSGIGLNQEQIGKLFKPFQQADTATTRRYGGTGLGLSISKQLVELMGGKIGVESTPGQGSRFYFTVLCGRREEQVSHSTPATGLANMRVLVVDDNAASRHVLQAMLQAFHMDVTLVDSGEACLAALEAAGDERPFQLVLMDWMMPGQDGIEVAARIKQHKRLAAIPTIIMVTSHKHQALRRRAQAEGLDGFLLKPINRSVMLDTITEVLQQTLAQSPHPMVDLGSEDQVLRILKGARVLLVEDNEFNQMVATGILGTVGVEVTVANNGQEALEKLQLEDFNAVLMDANMPVMDGYAATLAIREQPQFQTLPIIAMTASASSKDRAKCLDSGMNDHVSKPIDPKKLFATLARWLPKNHKETTSAQQAHATTVAPLMSLPGINMEEGLERFAGDSETYKEIMLEFLKIHGEDAAKIGGLLASEEQPLAQKMLHTLKGSAGHLSANELYAAVCELEDCLGTDDRSKDIEALFATLEHCLDKVCHSLQTLQSSTDS